MIYFLSRQIGTIKDVAGRAKKGLIGVDYLS